MTTKSNYTTDLETLSLVPVPAQTSTYKPVSHTQLAKLTRDALLKCNFHLEKEVYTSSKDGQVANGKYFIRMGNDPDMSLLIAWQNSYNRKVSLKFALGTWVFVCENGCVGSDIGAFKSKHVGNIQEITPARIEEYICQAAETFNTMVEDKEVMKQRLISRKSAAELLGVLFIDEDVITSTQLNTVKREMNNPTHDYGAPGTVWELYNYITFALKDANPRHWMQAQTDIHEFFVKEFVYDD